MTPMTLIEKLPAAVLVAGAGMPTLFHNEITTQVIGVSVTTVGAAVLGTYAAIGYDDRTLPRGKMLALAVGNVIIASSIVGAIPRWLGWEWNNGGAEGALCALVAFLTYLWMPPIIKRGREIISTLKPADFVPGKRGAARADEPPAGDGPDEGDSTR